MNIKNTVSPDDLPFEHPLQSTSGKLTRALQSLNGSVLPVELSDGEVLANVRQNIYYAAKSLGLSINTTVHDNTIYVWKGAAA